MFMHTTSHTIWHTTSYAMFMDWIWSWIQGVQISCTIAQAQEFAWQWIHSDIDHPTSGGRGRRPLNAIAAARQRRQGQHPLLLRGLGKITRSVRSMRVHSQVRMRAMPRMSSGGMRVQSQARMRACRAAAARFRRERNRLDRRNT